MPRKECTSRRKPIILIALPISIVALAFVILKGDLDQAVEVLQRCQKFCQDANIRVLVPQITSCLGFGYALSGRIDEALPLLQQAEAETLSIGRTSGQSLRVNWQGEAYLMAGRLDEATSFAQRGFELSKKHKEQGHGAWSLKLLGEVASRQELPNVPGRRSLL